MKNKILFLSKILLSFIIGFSFLGNLNPSVKASSNNEPTEKEVNELEKALEVVFDKASVENNGQVVGFKESIIKDELKGNAYYDELYDSLKEGGPLLSDNEAEKYSKGDNQISENALRAKGGGKWGATDWLNARNGCMVRKMPDIAGISASSAVIDAITQKSWKKAAKLLLKLGGKGTVVGIAGSLVYEYGQCNAEANKKYPSEGFG